MGRYKALRWEKNRISYHLSYRCWPKEPMVISVFLSVSFDFDPATFNLTLLTIPYWSSSILMIRAMGQWFRAWSFRTRRTSPTWRFLDIPFHLTLDCNVTRFPFSLLTRTRLWYVTLDDTFLSSTNQTFWNVLLAPLPHLISWSIYCLVKSVQIRSYFWSAFSRMQTEYGEIQSISSYSVQMQENRDQK